MITNPCGDQLITYTQYTQRLGQAENLIVLIYLRVDKREPTAVQVLIVVHVDVDMVCHDLQISDKFGVYHLWVLWGITNERVLNIRPELCWVLEYYLVLQ
ncbi:hypothetical protein WICPIJ_005357 [Wickerhamomyces pijperi]|uniref:Uncharacterized protein n=1 Tax=Wickerhamomyces pijperi TaxID=599730 RepID=A0A9P8TL72_WICPI|nr:hypothetical protein WICPIJ_005357 [Wickerhamomyces pijperi]